MKKLILSIGAIIFIGCGGGSSSSNASATKTINGKVVDGYVKGATVCIDKNRNFKCDNSEIKTTTNSKGEYTLKVNNLNSNDLIISIGGIDTETNTPAPVMYSFVKYKNITPVTTLVANGLSEDEVAKKLGISKNEIAKDPIKDEKLKVVADKVVKLIKKYGVEEVVKELEKSNVDIDTVENFVINQIDINSENALKEDKLQKDINISKSENSKDNKLQKDLNITQNSTDKKSNLKDEKELNPPSFPDLSSSVNKIYINGVALDCSNGKCSDIVTSNTSYTFKLQTPSNANIKLGFELYRYSNKTTYKLAVDTIKIKDAKLENSIFHVCVEKAGNGACNDVNNSKYHIIEYNKPFLVVNSQNVAKVFNKTIPNTKESFKIDFYVEGVKIEGFIPASKWGVGMEGFGGVYLNNPEKAEFKLQIK